VTGAAMGIGRSIAVALAEQGADVAFIDIAAPATLEETATLVGAAGTRVLAVHGDVGDAAAVDAFARRVEAELGPIRVWVNSAARMLVRPFLETSDEDWRLLLDTNLLGYVHGCRAAARAMLASAAGGRIVNVTSIVHLQPIADLAAYVTAKGAVAALTKVLAVELGPQGITVNAVAPGATDTPLNRDAYTPQVRATYEARIPVHRIASPEEVAAAVVLLCGDGAAYINGAELIADGGLMLNGSVGHART
jgi:NAD(P)-dependent dehydrogenase (short-subunit alcohol dehydrogenase family)